MHSSFSGDILYEGKTLSTFLGLTVSPSSEINAHIHKLFCKSPHSYHSFHCENFNSYVTKPLIASSKTSTTALGLQMSVSCITDACIR